MSDAGRERDQFLALTAEARETFVRSEGEAPASFGERVRILAMLGRPRTCITTLLSYLLGVAYVGERFSARLVIGAVLCLAGTFLGNLANAYTDLKEDCRNLPGRVYLLAQFGYVRFRVLLLAFGVLMLVFGAACGLPCFLFMMVALALVHQYSFAPLRAKNRPLLGLFVFAQVVAVPFVVAAFIDTAARFFVSVVHAMGQLLAGGSFAGDLAPRRFVAMWLFLTAWFLAKGLVKNVPDYDGDRLAGVRTSATICGSWARAKGIAVGVTLLVYASFGLLVLAGLEQPRVSWSLAWLVPIGWNGVVLWRARTAEAANRALHVDMILSVGFISTVLLVVAPTLGNAVAVAMGVAVMVASDRLNIDSRRRDDLEGSSA